MRKLKEKLVERTIAKAFEHGGKGGSAESEGAEEVHEESGGETSDGSNVEPRKGIKKIFHLPRRSRRKKGKDNASSDEESSERGDKDDTDDTGTPTTSDEETSATETDDEEPQRGRKERHSRAAVRDFENTDKSGIYHVMVRVIEGKDLPGVNLRVGVSLDGRTESTRVSSENDPRWRQNVSFTLTKSLEKLSNTILMLRLYQENRVMRDTLMGEWECFLGAIVHQPDRMVSSKWIALRNPSEESAGHESENVGFIKVSICIYGNNETPPVMADEESEDLFCGAQLRLYTLRIRLFRMHAIPEELQNPLKKTHQEAHFAVKVFCGDFNQECPARTIQDEDGRKSIAFNSELTLPIMWPTVINSIYFILILSNGKKKKRIVARAQIRLSGIYESGEDGFLPLFGPSFLNLYGPQQIPAIKWRREKAVLGDFQEYRYYGRLLVAVDCVDAPSEHPSVGRLPHDAHNNAGKFEKNFKYALCGSFFACNRIDAAYSTSSIHFVVSIGDYGDKKPYEPSCSSSTLGVMPNFDKMKYFTLPWGNYKPAIHMNCVFDNVAFRIERMNAIMKVTTVLDGLIDRARVVGESSLDEVAFTTVEAVEQTCLMLNNLYSHHKEDQLCTQLDVKRHESRRNHIKMMKDELVNLKYEKYGLNEACDAAIRLLVRIRDRVKRMAKDDSASLPDVFIKMYADDVLVGSTRIPSAKVFYSKHDALRGDQCGRIHPYAIDYLENQQAKEKREDVACVLHAKLWIGDRAKVSAWKNSLAPAEQKSFFEIFHYQTRSLLSQWHNAKVAYADETGVHDLGKYLETPPAGWEFKNSYIVMNTHDTWIQGDAGRKTVVDKLFDLEWKRGGDTNAKWSHMSYTDYFGRVMPKDKLKDKAPPGWDWEGEWLPDLHTHGDAEGWCYSLSNCFWGETEMLDNKERHAHLFRRRGLQRLRISKDYKETHEQLLGFEESLGPEEKWEYSLKKGKGFHDSSDRQDTVRRRRFIIEAIRKTNEKKLSSTANLPRLFVVQHPISRWQLRSYILWAKELLPTSKSRVFCRVMFMNECKQTRVIDNSANPVFNETLIFNELLIPGGHYDIFNNPPSVLVELRAERGDDTEVFLGRFTAKPVVIRSAIDRRGSLGWQTLHFRNNRTRGALLVLFELFQTPYEEDQQKYLPLLPAKKKAESNRFEIPKDMLPEFANYTVQILCWGVRNLSKYELLAVRRPFVEVVVGDFDTLTDALDDTNKNPNFEEPWVTFPEVQLPVQLNLASPLVLNVRDCRAFKRTPLVGTCNISNFTPYIRPPASAKREAQAVHDYSTFDIFVDEQDSIASENSKASDFTSYEKDSDPRIDWWSKYFASTDQIHRAPGFEESGLERITVYNKSLEDVPGFKRFEDFLDTFKFRKSAKGHFDDAEAKEVTGEMKGKLFITKNMNGVPSVLRNPPGVEFNGPTRCTVRVYIIEANALVAPRSSGTCDPYIVVRIGKQKVKLKKEYRADTVDPDFGQLIELSVNIPVEKDLTITVMDRRKILADEEIGATHIDLENRLLTKFRATAGLPKEYIVKGELGWRDQQTPLTILRRYCKKMLLPAPEPIYVVDKENKQELLGLRLLGMAFLIKDLPTPKRAEMVGRPIQRVALYILHKVGLVSEHVETRVLFNKHHGTSECGRLKLFVDIFPECLSNIPPPVPISRRQPEPYQLRIALFHVVNSILVKRSFGKPTADLYFKVFLNGEKKPQKTDIHYRVTDGYGSFNWRFLINLDYNPWERKVYMYEKKRLFRKSREQLVEPLLVIQMWDNNKFSKDGLLGEYVINLCDIEEGKMDEGEIRRVEYAREKRRCCCVSCCGVLCSLCLVCCCHRKEKKKELPLPRCPKYDPPKRDEKEPQSSIFETYATRGTWPLLSKHLNYKQKADPVGRRKKNDDVADDDEYVTGCVEMELQMVTKQEAQRDPVGKKRNKPNHNPFLEKPERSKWDNFWFTSRIKPCISFWWNKVGKKFLVILLLVVLLILFIAAMIYHGSNLPFQAIMKG